MAQKGTEGIQIISMQEVNLSIDSLASRTALKIVSDHESALKEPFLMKKVRLMATARNITPNQGWRIVIGLARGGVSVTQIKAALEDNLFERNKKGQAAKRDVLFETLTLIKRTNFDGTHGTYDSGMISLGGGKGIPFDEDGGWQVFAFNFGAGAMTTMDLDFLGVAWGVWL